MLVEPFAQGHSPLHRLDPRGKVIVAFFYALLLAVAQKTMVILLGLLGAVALAMLARLSGAAFWRRLAAVQAFLLMLWLVLPFTYGGASVGQIMGLAVSGPGVDHALRVTMKANAIVLAFWALVATTPMVTIGHALQRLWLPGKLTHLLLFTYRYLHVIEGEYRALAHAALVRGFQPRLGLHALRTYANLAGMILLRSLSRAQRVHSAMLCRGFRGRLYCLAELTMTKKDMAMLTVLGAALIVLGCGEWLLIPLF